MPRKKKRGPGRSRQPVPPPTFTPLTADYLAQRMAENATLWIYREVARLKGKVPRPGWVPPDSVGKELQKLLEEKFLREAEERLAQGPDHRFGAIEAACGAWAAKKYGTVHAEAFGKRLAGIAIGVLFSSGAFGVIPTVRAAHELVGQREQAPLSPEEREKLEVKLKRYRLPPGLLQTVLANARRSKDPVANLLRHFFSVRDGYWRRFLDRQGRVRSRKLPNLPDAAKALAEALRRPEASKAASAVMPWGPHPPGLSLSASDAYQLTSELLKATFPDQARKITPANLKALLSYHKGMQKRPESTRGKYGRV